MEVGSSEVVVKGNIAPLEQSLVKGQQTLANFDKTANQTGQSISGKFSLAMRNGTQAAQNFGLTLQKSSAALGTIPGPAGAAAARVTSLTTMLGSMGVVGAAAGLALGALVVGLKDGIEAAEKFERSGVKVEQSLKSTGHAAGLTSGQIRELATEIDDTTLQSSQNVERAAQALITFGNTSGEEFKRTIRLAEDLAAATGTDLVSAVTKLGTAFERPEQSARRFRDIGLHEVVLLQAQAFKDAGKEAEAHGVILDAIQKKVGGAGKGENRGLAGAYDNLSDNTERFMALIGNSGPLQLWTSIINTMAEGVKGFTRDLFGANTALKMGTQDGIVAREAAKKGAEIAAKQRVADDAQAKVLKKAEEDKKKAAQEAERQAKRDADQLKELNKQRAEAVTLATSEASALEALLPRLLQEGLTNEQISKSMQTEQHLVQELTRLHLERNSAQGKELEAQLTKHQKLLDSLDQELKKRDLIKDAQQKVSDIDQNTATVGMSEESAAKFAFTQGLVNEAMQKGIPITDDLTKKIGELGNSFDRANKANISAKFFDQANQGINEMTLQLNAAQASFSMSTREAAAFNYEQQKLAELSRQVDHITPEQAAQIHQLGLEYADLSEKMKKLQEMQQTSDFFNGTLSETLSDIVFEAKDVGSAFADMGKEIAKAALQAAVFGTGPLAGLFGGSGGGGLLGGMGAGSGGGGGLFGGILKGGGGLLSSILHEGGNGSNAPRRMVPMSTFIRAPRLHNGLMSDEFPAILQRGEEVTSRKNVGKSKGGGPTYIWNVQTPDANSFMASKRQLTQQAKRRLQ